MSSSSNSSVSERDEDSRVRTAPLLLGFESREDSGQDGARPLSVPDDVRTLAPIPRRHCGRSLPG